MPRQLIILLMGLLLLLPSIGRTADPPFHNIQPVQWVSDEGHGPILGVHCTAWAFRQGTVTVWVTAHHCVESPLPIDGKFYIGAREATVTAINPPLDIAVLTGGPAAAGFALAAQAPRVLESVWSGGYPFGSHALLVTAGVWSQSRDDEGWSVYAVPVAPGMSGAPVLNQRNQVVGIVRQKMCWGSVFCPVGRGAGMEQLRLVLLGR